MNPMISNLQIELSKSNKELKELKIKVIRLMNELQSNINPYFGDDFNEINAVEIEQIGDELLECKEKALKLQEKINKIKGDLGYGDKRNS